MISAISPSCANILRFWVASTALETNSRKKISWSLYRNCLMMGKMLSVVTLMVPCCAMLMCVQMKRRRPRATSFDSQFLCQSTSERRYTSLFNSNVYGT